MSETDRVDDELLELEWPAPMTTGRVAELLGLTHAEVRRLDPRISSSLALDRGGLARTRLWLAAGQPDADPEAVCFEGDPTIRTVLVATMRLLPKPVRHSLVTGVEFIGTGVDSGGWYDGAIAPLPSPTGDRPRRIVIARADEDTPAHEAGHHWPSEPNTAVSPARSWADRNRVAMLAAEVDRAECGTKYVGMIAQRRAPGELRADSLASLWLGRRVVNYCNGRYAEVLAGMIHLEAAAAEPEAP